MTDEKHFILNNYGWGDYQVDDVIEFAGLEWEVIEWPIDGMWEWAVPLRPLDNDVPYVTIAHADAIKFLRKPSSYHEVIEVDEYDVWYGGGEFEVRVPSGDEEVHVRRRMS